MTKNEKDIAALMATRIQADRAEAEFAITAFISALHDTLLMPGIKRVRITGLGAFDIRVTKPKNVHNPVTRTIELHPPHRKIAFRPVKEIKDAMMQEVQTDA